MTAAVQVVAHRGASGAYPEHTLQAFEAAIADGADALECDVRLTRDGVLVCVHDRKVDRTSDGRGVVSTLELADLHELDFASWKDRGSSADPWEEPDRDAGRVLTLERLLALVLDQRTPDGRAVQLQIETKHPTRYGALVETGLIGLLERYGLAAPPTRDDSRVAVLSYSPTSLRRIRAFAPLLPTVLNMDRVPLRIRSGTFPRHLWAAAVYLPVLRAHPGLVQRMHTAGVRTHVFTVDDPSDIDYLLALGVDAIISNEPALVLARAGRS